MKRLLFLGMALVLAAAASGCGDDDDVVFISGPGFIAIDDSTVGREPALTVTYVDCVTLLSATVTILSDPVSDGDIAFDPVLNTFTVTPNTTVLFMGVDSLDPHLPEFRAFLTYPGDGVPSGAFIDNALLEVCLTEVSFAGVVPTFLDLVPYGVLDFTDFNAAFLDFRSLDFFSSDAGICVSIDVTPLVQTAQDQNLLDFQFRFSVDLRAGVAGAQSARPQAELKKADRTASPSSIAPTRPTRTPPAVPQAAPRSRRR